MDIFEKIENYLQNEKVDKTDDKVLGLLESYKSLDESRKSQFVAKLIGLGILVRDKDGNLVPGKVKATKEEVIAKLNKKQKGKK